METWRQYFREPDMDAYMRSVTRALSVLEELNVNNGASITELHRATGISRPALYRIVRTLENAGYLIADDVTQRHHLTPLVRRLSDGFEKDSWISEVAGPVLDKLQKQVIWPTDLFSFLDDSMVMRRTTRKASPWTIDSAKVGLRIPVLTTACGRAYLSRLAAAAVEDVLQRLRRSKLPDEAIACDPRLVDRLLKKIREDGYAFRERGVMKETCSVAVPVLDFEGARCSIAVTYVPSAISTKDVIERFVPLLKKAAAQIEGDINDKS